MDWLHRADLTLFHLVNRTWSNPVFDIIMPFLSGNRLFMPALALLVGGLIWKGGTRGRCFVAVMALVLILGEGLVTAPLKKASGRERPYTVLGDEGVQLRAGKSGSKAMPSGHAALWAAATTVTFLFYRRAGRWVLLVAAGVGYSRVYVGVHWPTDVLAGFAVGTGYAWIISHAYEWYWQRIFRAGWPRWWALRPSLLRPEAPAEPLPPEQSTPAAIDRHWLRLGWMLIGVLLVARLGYLGAGIIELSEDEAYQWLWSKHPALSYYSKPPFIAYAQWIGTHIAGDRELGVRLLSPIISALLSGIVLRFVASHSTAQTGFWCILALQATPLLAVGSILMTIDPLTVLFWTLAMLSGWRAITTDSTRAWLLTGLWLGGGFLSKYFSPFQWACFALFFVICPAARVQLRRPGPWLALAINVACMLPVFFWNQSHDWITVRHLGERSGLQRQWEPTLRFFLDFVGAVPMLLNPVFFVGLVRAGVAIWGKTYGRELSGKPTASASRDSAWGPPVLLRYLWCMGAPVFLFYFVYTLRARVQPNWICTSVVPLALVATLHAHYQALAGARWPRFGLAAGLAFGLPIVLVLHDTNIVAKLTGSFLPAKIDPSRRVRAHREMSRVVEAQRTAFQRDGKPVFIIANHYGLAGLLSFYDPAAQKRVPNDPLVYVRSSDVPENQLWFWPRYRYGSRIGDDALYVQQSDEPPGSIDRLKTEFTTVTDLGVFDVLYRGRVFHRLQIFGCRGLRAPADR